MATYEPGQIVNVPRSKRGPPDDSGNWRFAGAPAGDDQNQWQYTGPGGSESSGGNGESGGEGGSEGGGFETAQFGAFPPPPGINAPGQQVPTEQDAQQFYQDALSQGQRWLEKLRDPTFIDLVSSSMAMKFRPPPGWEQLLQGPQQGQGNAFSQYQPQGFNAASYTNPYTQLLQQGGAQVTSPAPTTGIQFGGHYGNTGSTS